MLPSSLLLQALHGHGLGLMVWAIDFKQRQDHLPVEHQRPPVYEPNLGGMFPIQKAALLPAVFAKLTILLPGLPKTCQVRHPFRFDHLARRSLRHEGVGHTEVWQREKALREVS